MWRLSFITSIICCVVVILSATEEVSRAVVAKYEMSSGVQLSFVDSTAQSALVQWAKELDESGKKLTYDQAVIREREVVVAIKSGQWPEEAYEDYQRMAAGTGNVDSAGILVRYGLGPLVKDTAALTSDVGLFHKSVLLCKGEDFLDLFDMGVAIDIAAADGTTPLVTAAYSGCVPIVSVLLGEGADVEAAGAHGLTALMAAASVGNDEVIQVLVSEGNADVNSRHAFAGSTALHFAAEMNHGSTIEMLCDMGGDFKSINTIGSTPLHVAAHAGANSSILALVQHCGANVGALMYGEERVTPLYLAAELGHTEAVKVLLDVGADPNTNIPISEDFAKHRNDLSQILAVAREGGLGANNQGGENEEITESGEERGDVVNGVEDPVAGTDEEDRPKTRLGLARVKGGAQAIHVACEHGHFETVQVLIDGGADMQQRSMGLAPLHISALHNRYEVVRTLLEAGVDVDSISDEDLDGAGGGGSALYYAAGLGYDVVVKMLLQSGAAVSIPRTKNTDPKKKGKKNGEESVPDVYPSPLIYAVTHNQMHIVRILLTEGEADPNEIAPDGMRPVHIACLQGHLAALTTLSVDKANIFLSGPNNMTPFHLAAINGHEAIITELVAIRVHRRDATFVTDSVLDMQTTTDGATALHLAANNGDYVICRKLLQAGAKPSIKMKSDTAYGATAMYLAAQSGNPFLVTLLIRAGGNPNARLDKIFSTPLLTAIERNDSAVVLALLEGATIDKQFARADISSWSDSEDDAAVVVKANPDKGVLGSGPSASPLLLAVVHGHVGIVQELLLHGAKDCKDIKLAASQEHPELSLIEIARMQDNFEMLSALLSFSDCVHGVNGDNREDDTLTLEEAERQAMLGRDADANDDGFE